jgi:hypothetical protein
MGYSMHSPRAHEAVTRARLPGGQAPTQDDTRADEASEYRTWASTALTGGSPSTVGASCFRVRSRASLYLGPSCRPARSLAARPTCVCIRAHFV